VIERAAARKTGDRAVDFLTYSECVVNVLTLSRT